MNVLFLDIDGVMNNDNLLTFGGWNTIGDVQLDMLKKIVELTNAKIVLSSTWRLEDFTKKLVEEALATKGLELFDSTIEIKDNNRSIVPRSSEILEWLSRHPDVLRFAVLDDCSDAGLEIEDNFFKTDFSDGLTWFIADNVIEHFQSAMEE